MYAQAPALQAMHNVSCIEIHEKVSVIEAATALLGQEVEMANRYSIHDGKSGEQLFYATETTDCCARQFGQCCSACAPWSVDILHTERGSAHKAFHLEKPWSCTCLCINRPEVEVTDSNTGHKIGSITDPLTCCNFAFHVKDASGKAVLRADGGCCQLGIWCPCPCGPCAKVEFEVNDIQGNHVGHMQKRIPGCCTWMLAPDVDHYKIDFGSVRSAVHKSLLMSLAIFTDMRYFNDNSNDDEAGQEGSWNPLPQILPRIV